MNSKGIIYVWIIVLLAIFGVTFLWFILNEPILNIWSWFTGTTWYQNHTTVKNVADLMYNVWNWFPILLILGLLIYAYVRSHTPEDYGYEYARY